jgi:hypothetical protein
MLMKPSRKAGSLVWGVDQLSSPGRTLNSGDLEHDLVRCRMVWGGDGGVGDGNESLGNTS